jgi:hypothetical protein
MKINVKRIMTGETDKCKCTAIKYVSDKIIFRPSAREADKVIPKQISVLNVSE